MKKKPKKIDKIVQEIIERNPKEIAKLMDYIEKRRKLGLKPGERYKK